MIRMPKTIRTKLFLSFTGAILILQVFFWAMSSFGMETIAIVGRERNMKGLLVHYNEWSKMMGEEEVFTQLAIASDGNLTFVDTESGHYYSTMPMMRNDRMMPNRGRSAFQIVSSNSDLVQGEVKTLIVKDQNGIASQVTVIGKLTEEKYLISDRQISVIRESSKLLSSYLAFAGLIIVVVGALISHWMARRITKPIIDIEEQAVRISKLEFNSHNDINSVDEIGSLASAVNQISFSLEEKINQLSEANLRLKGEIEQERQLDSARRSFVANVSHELKTPISMIMGYADGLKHGVARTEIQKNQYYDVIIKESEHMSKLINQLLDLSAYQAGKLPCHMRAIDFNHLVEETIRRHEHLFTERELLLQWSLTGELLVNADPERLEMVLSNLLSNACKYADKGTTVSLNTANRDGLLSFELSNACSDFEREDLEQLTVSFFRGKNARERQVEGFGIGLGAVNDTINLHGGKMTIGLSESIFKVSIEMPLLITPKGIES